MAEQKPLLHPCGFTLLEALLVLLLLSILAAIAVPNWRALVPSFHLNSGARQVQSELQRTKARAVSGNTDYRLLFSKGGYLVERKLDKTWHPAGENRELPAGIRIRPATPASLGFTGKGTATPGVGGTVMLCNSLGQGNNVVVSSSGRIRICRPVTCDAAC